MLAEPERTAYDLRFRLLGFPIRIHPLFWLGAALLGAFTLNMGFQYLLIWMAVVLVSLLVHELGHAVMFRWFGTDAAIVLYVFGGLAIPQAFVAGRWRRILISLAGPLAGFLLCAGVYVSNREFHWASNPEGFLTAGREVGFFYLALLWVNLYWGILNLLPVFPLDGGQVSRELCGLVWGPRGTRIALQISLAVAITLVAYSLLCVLTANGPALAGLPWWLPRGTIFTAILFGLLAYTSYQLLQQLRWTDSYWDDRGPWER